MITKLTLTIEYSVIEQAKKYAHKKGRSLSDIVENYLKSITTKQPDNAAISPKISKLRGSVKLPENFDYKTDLGKALSKKYKL